MLLFYWELCGLGKTLSIPDQFMAICDKVHIKGFAEEIWAHVRGEYLREI